MPHHGKVFLFRDGIPAKKQIPWLNQAKQILFKSRNAMDKWMRLIQRLRERGYHWTATYFENARPNLWTYQSFKKPVPTTTSLAEREMREINRRTDVGVRWSVEGVMNLLNLRMAHRFNSIQWNNLWQPITSEKLNFTVKLLNVNN
jgi:hypothetical protein